VADSEVPVYFSAADMLVLPYTRASQSGVAHIAMSYGLPIVASRVGGLVEGLEPYQGAFLINSENIGELREQILKVLEKKEVYPPPKDLTWDSIGDKWIKLCHYLRVIR